jgi:hypothetical protein
MSFDSESYTKLTPAFRLSASLLHPLVQLTRVSRNNIPLLQW